MKKSKKLLLVVLALAILTSLTAGTLAVYTKTVSLTGQIEAKKFAFAATGGIEGDKKAINLAPTESMAAGAGDRRFRVHSSAAGDGRRGAGRTEGRVARTAKSGIESVLSGA